MTRCRGLTNEEMKNFLEESDDEYIDFDDEIHDPDFQDPAHNLQYSSDSDECEMDIDLNTIPQNAKNSDALSDSDTASLSSVDEMPSATASGCRPILWFHADSSFQPRMTIPAESSPSLLFNLNRSATESDVFLKLFPKNLMIWISQCTKKTKYAKVNRSMKDGNKEEFECPVVIEFYNKIMRGVDFADQIANVYELDRKSRKWWKKSIFSPIDERSRQLMGIAYCELKHRKTPLLDLIVPFAEALMSSGKLNAQYQHRRGTGRPSKTSRSLLNVGDHLPVTTKTRRQCRKCAQQKKESRTKIMCTMCNVPLCIDCFKSYHS
ncbi:piggyBac transposable element-derived protein 4 [Trichonephila inaurata madagascariensis]|uniref:PiggyBac transposable element-derived protein 4 n=1 Tax=Trichonephila inaurata madagascariensis TaxID=2747483 RepID=A0A8X6X3J5_9ARAC|nr:piggyBac transposable element-derived protein 4 [Trichonephila inaurata madagascariensis]